MKKIYIFCLLLVVAVASIGVVFASSQEVGQRTFNVPDGFNEVNSSESHSAIGTTYNKLFKNDKGEIINLTVLVCDEGMHFTSFNPSDPGSENKTINGIDGFYWNSTPSDKIPRFTFIDNNNQRLVSIAATNANNIESFHTYFLFLKIVN